MASLDYVERTLPSPATVIYEPDTQLTFEEKSAGVVRAALSNGYGFACASFALPAEIQDVMSLTREGIAEEAMGPVYDMSGARYWNLVSKRRAPLAYDFGKSIAALASAEVGYKLTKGGVVYNELDPAGIGEPHEDDWLSVGFMQGDARILHRDVKQPAVPYFEALIEGSGVAVFCGEAMQKKINPKGVVPTHRVDNPSPERYRSSMVVQLAYHRAATLARIIVSDLSRAIAEEL